MKRLAILLLVLAFSLAFAQLPDLEGRVIRIGSDTTYPPMESINPDTGMPEGFDVDLMNALCERLNCSAEFVTTAWDGIFAALAQGEFDMVVSGVSITPERDEVVDFSDPYLSVSQAILTRVGEELTLEDFQNGGLTLASQIGTTNADVASELVGRDNVRLFDTFAAAVLALQNGDVDGVVIDGVSAGAYEQQFAGELTVGITGVTEGDPLGLVFQEGDPLVDAFNAALAELKADGTIDEIAANWGIAQ